MLLLATVLENSGSQPEVAPYFEVQLQLVQFVIRLEFSADH